MKSKIIPAVLSILAVVSLLLTTVPVALADDANPSWEVVYPEACDPTLDSNAVERQKVVALCKSEDKGEAGTELTLVSAEFASVKSSFASNGCYGWDSYSFDLTIEELTNAPTDLYLVLNIHEGFLTNGKNRTILQYDRGLGFKMDLVNNKLNVYRLRAHKGTNLAVDGGYGQFNFWDDLSEAEAAKSYEVTEFDFDPNLTHRFVVYCESQTTGSNGKKQFNMVFLMDGIVIHKEVVNEIGNDPDPNEDDFYNLRVAEPFKIIMGLNQQNLSTTPETAVTARVLIDVTPSKTVDDLSAAITENTEYAGSIEAVAENPALGQTTQAAKDEFLAAIAAAQTVLNGEDQSEEALYPALTVLNAAREKFYKSIVRPLDEEALKEAIQYAKDTMAMVGNTATGYAELQQLVAQAEALLQNATATAADGEAMVAALIDAADALELPGDPDDDTDPDDDYYYTDDDYSDINYGYSDELPQTGDSSAPIEAYIAVLAISAMGLVLFGKKCIKSR